MSRCREATIAVWAIVSVYLSIRQSNDGVIKQNGYTRLPRQSDMVRISTIVIVLAIVLGIGLLPIPIVPGIGILVGLSGIVLGVVLRLLGY